MVENYICKYVPVSSVEHIEAESENEVLGIYVKHLVAIYRLPHGSKLEIEITNSKNVKHSYAVTVSILVQFESVHL